jgi:hypothetical protein
MERGATVGEPMNGFLSMTARNKLVKHANRDTPGDVDVPNSWAGLISWMVGRHGPITVALVFVVWLHQDSKKFQERLYEDNRAMQERVLAAFTVQTEVNAKTVLALAGVSDALEDMRRDAESAHKRGTL